ncbi:uncharacterized protein EV420DRAFT_1143745 [Desarmillaria tabescens]|uniref:Uncharacterized protein n=1 Tax=Armillaria tabescens TaxID=1929756 RepID=A0AA39TT79_ARMTA|nr:uncharacterized protein EV420DRAFT_1143745 [Desarmillaria tabescens]KAK0462899.1 hypothetical protein EV420DRAFT_1143745 [Desarmillaria tabescens]
MALNLHSAGSIRAPSIDNFFQSDAGSAYHVVVGSDDAYRVESLSDDEISPPEEEYDIFDLELVTSVGAKQTEISVRRRNPTLTSSGRPTYKVEKKTVSHFLGKKNMAVVINRNEGLSAVNSNSRSRMHPKGYAPIFEAHDENTRQITMTATPQCVLSGTVRGNRVTISPSCGSYDPQNSRTHKRDGTAYHFFALVISDLSSNPPGVESNDPMGIPKPSYPGGGYFVFDANSQGRKELLCSLYCTRYDKRHRIHPDDILVAELRLPNLPNPAFSSSSSKPPVPSWTRLFREHHASLHISKRAIDACFSGEDVRILASKPVPGKRHFFTREQGLEIIVSAMTMSLLAIEHDGLESKKWMWLNSREAVEQPAAPRKVEVAAGAGAAPDRVSIASRDTLMSTEEPETVKTPEGTDWAVMTYNSEISLRRAAWSQCEGVIVHR